MKLLFKNAYIVDVKSPYHLQTVDVLVDDDQIISIGGLDESSADHTIDLMGSTLTTGLSAETAARSAAIAVMQTSITNEAITRAASDNVNTSAIANEVSRATGAESVLTAAVALELSSRVSAVSGLESTVNSNIIFLRRMTLKILYLSHPR